MGFWVGKLREGGPLRPAHRDGRACTEPLSEVLVMSESYACLFIVFYHGLWGPLYPGTSCSLSLAAGGLGDTGGQVRGHGDKAVNWKEHGFHFNLSLGIV